MARMQSAVSRCAIAALDSGEPRDLLIVFPAQPGGTQNEDTFSDQHRENRTYLIDPGERRVIEEID
jgi:hypothetical protein